MTMNKTIIININGLVFHIEEDAYEILRSYMIDIKKHFAYTEGSNEIVADIENRIAEMFGERIASGKKEVITLSDVQEICAQMGKVEDFDLGTEEKQADYFNEESQANYVYSSSSSKRLMRDPDDRVFGGVCSGLGHYFDMEPRWVRLIFLLIFFFGGTGLFLYLILWIIMPEARTRADRMAMRGEEANLQNFKRSFDEERESGYSYSQYAKASNKDSLGDGLAKIGVVLLKILGIFLLIVFGMTVAGLTIGLVALLISGVPIDGDFPLNFVEPKWFTITAFSAFFMIAIPFLALTFLTIRVVFDRAPMSSYLSYALLIVWLVSSGVVVAMTFRTLQDFKEEAQIEEETPLQPSPSYVLEMGDIEGFIPFYGQDTAMRTNDSWPNGSAFQEPTRHKTTKIKFRNNWGYMPRASIYIDKAIDGESPSVTVEFTAKGRTARIAADRASKITYALKQEGDKLFIDKYIQIPKGEILREQEGKVTLRFPVGTRLLLSRECEYNIWDLPTNQCREGYGKSYTGYTEWIVTEDGLKCTREPIHGEEPGNVPDSIRVDLNIEN